MTLGQYCIIYNKYFTERECDAIQTAETIELEEGRIGNGETDPDAFRDEAFLELTMTLLDNQM